MAGLVPAIHVLLTEPMQERRGCPRQAAGVTPRVGFEPGVSFDPIAIRCGKLDRICLLSKRFTVEAVIEVMAGLVPAIHVLLS